jgi:hypothetical protein
LKDLESSSRRDIKAEEKQETAQQNPVGVAPTGLLFKNT